MNVKMYRFPTLNDGIAAVETEYCDLLNEKRNGVSLDPEVLDWMDYANNVLTTA